MLPLTTIAAAGDTLTSAEERQAYGDLFRIGVHQVGAGRFYSVDVAPRDPAHPLAAFATENARLLDFLLQHGPGFRLDSIARGDSAGAQARFAAALAGDSAFNALVLPLVSRYLAAHGGRLVGLESPPERRRVPLQAFTVVAVRFFDPFLDERGEILTHVCTSYNGLAELPGPCDLPLQALAFSAIMGDVLRGSQSRIEPDFGPARRLMSDLQLGGVPEVRLRRAQGVMWGAMAQSRLLREVLLAEYAAKAAYLPFVLDTTAR